MRKSLLTLPMLLALATAAALSTPLEAGAQDGGKLNWRGKGKDDPKTGMADAKKQGKAIMLFFTSEG